MKRVAVLAFAFLLLTASAALAESKAAKAHYDRGVTQYNLGHFADAIAEFEKAYEIEPAPVLLFNIAQGHRQLGNNERAIFFYRRYLESAPNGSNRPDVEKRIHDLEELLQKQGDAKRQPPTQVEPSAGTAAGSAAGATAAAGAAGAVPTAGAAPQAAEAAPRPPVTVVAPGEEAPRRGAKLRMAGIATAAGGAACMAAGVIFGAMASSKSDSVTSAMQFNPSDDAAGRRDATLQWVFYGVGAAAVGTGAILYYLGWRAGAGESSVALAPSFGPGGTAVSLRVGF